MEYEVLELKRASELKKDAKFLMIIDFNYAKVYLLNDSTYLVTPFFPFANSIHILNKNLLDKFIGEQSFPVEEEVNKFYLDNKRYIDDLIKYKTELKEQLITYILNGENDFSIEASYKQFDNIYNTLKQKRKIKKYQLNFIVLLGDYLIEKYNARNLKWGLLASKRLLNPIINLILVENEKNGVYFNIQESVAGKWPYLGVQNIFDDIENNTNKSDDFDKIIKIM